MPERKLSLTTKENLPPGVRKLRVNDPDNWHSFTHKNQVGGLLLHKYLQSQLQSGEKIFANVTGFFWGDRKILQKIGEMECVEVNGDSMAETVCKMAPDVPPYQFDGFYAVKDQPSLL